MRGNVITVGTVQIRHRDEESTIGRDLQTAPGYPVGHRRRQHRNGDNDPRPPTDIEIVGARVYSDAKNGTDVGTLVDRPPIGVTATNDMARILALDADLVLYAPSFTSVDDVCALLESGKDVATVSFLFHPRRAPEADRLRLAEACRKGGSTLHASGLNRATSRSAAARPFGDEQDHRQVHPAGASRLVIVGEHRHHVRRDVVRTSTGGHHTDGERILSFNAGCSPSRPGSSPTRSTQRSMTWRSPSKPFQQPRTSRSSTTPSLRARPQVSDGVGRQPPGRGTYRVQDWTIGGEYPDHWPKPDDGWTLTLEGDPSMRVHFFCLASYSRPASVEEHVRAGLIAVAMQVVNAIPAICAAPPGFATMADLPLIRQSHRFRRPRCRHWRHVSHALDGAPCLLNNRRHFTISPCLRPCATRARYRNCPAQGAFEV